MTAATKAQQARARDQDDAELRKRRAEDELALLKAKRKAGKLTVKENPDGLEGILNAGGRKPTVPMLRAKDFKWGDRLGAGAFGEVEAATYLRDDGAMPKGVAIKSSKETQKADTDACLAHAADNYEVAALHVALDHDAFLQAHGIFSTTNPHRGTVQQHQVLELLEDGEGLADLIGSYTPAEVCQLGDQLLDALSHLHARGIVHRDIKPENLHVESDLHLRVLDLGCATKRRELTILENTGVAGTITYLAPETGGGEAYGRVDVYA